MTHMDLKWIKEAISTSEAPAAVGPYSQAVAAGPLVFVSGQLGLVPGRKELAGGTIEEQTKQALENIAAILDKAGSSLELVMRTTVYLIDIKDFPSFNAEYSKFFSVEPPARAAVQVASLPLGGRVMIDAVALRD